MLLLVAWGAFAFGAVYPWAYWPLAAACQLAGLASTFVGRGVMTRCATPAFVATLAAFAVCVCVQVLPMPAGTLAAVSPGTPALVSRLDPAFAADLVRTHPISIDPRSTWTALGLYLSLAVLFLAMARSLSFTGARRIVEGVTVLAVVLALTGIIQKPLYSGKIFGFWTPEGAGNPFGPFVNKNHFAGWMLMALPLALALLAAGAARAMHGVRPEWRYRILWLSSPEASRLVLLAAAAVVMSLSLVMTMSRSGITALALSLALTGGFVVRGAGSRSRKSAIWAYLVLLTVIVVGWVGLDAIVTRFSQADWSEFNDRRGAWADAWSVATKFPLSGTGLNTYGTATLFHQRHDLARHYAQAHGDYVQLAAEGGLLLLIPAVIIIVFFARNVRRRLREDERGSTTWWLRAGAITSLIAMALQETVEFSLQIPGNAALFVVVCAIALHWPRSRRENAFHGRDASTSTLALA